MRKLIYATAFGIGYVLGARAGRGRYEQIRDAAEKVQADPRVQEATRKAETFAREAAQKAQDDERLGDLASTVRESAQKVRDEAVDAVANARGKVDELRDQGSEAGAGQHKAPSSSPVSSEPGTTWPPHPDEHVAEVEDELVHSTGPDSRA